MSARLPRSKSNSFVALSAGDVYPSIPANVRLAYFILETEIDAGGYIPCIAVENTSGYYRTDWRWNCDLETARRLVDERNNLLGLTLQEAMLIQISTMRGKGTELITLQLRKGMIVLARKTAHGPKAMTYANFKQAEAKAKKLREAGIRCEVIGYGLPAKHIRILE